MRSSCGGSSAICRKPASHSRSCRKSLIRGCIRPPYVTRVRAAFLPIISPDSSGFAIANTAVRICSDNPPQVSLCKIDEQTIIRLALSSQNIIDTQAALGVEYQVSRPYSDASRMECQFHFLGPDCCVVARRGFDAEDDVAAIEFAWTIYRSIPVPHQGFGFGKESAESIPKAARSICYVS